MKDKYKLYAISTGHVIKIGLSKRIDKTLQTMQRTTEDELELIWSYYVGKDRNKARRELAKLQRFCKAHSDGDNFSMDAEKMIRKFSVKLIGRQAGMES